METSYVQLTAVEVSLAAVLILINAAISMALRLGVERTLLIASVRTILQLMLIGYILQWVFEIDRWYLVAALLAVMTLIAGVTAVRGSRRRYPGIWLNSLLAMWVSSWLIAAYGMMLVMHEVDRWYHPQYAIPLLGMILGNTLNGISLGLNSLTETLMARREQVEALLALGATRWEAARGAVQDAVRTGMIPIINMMMVVGIVSLPGMMTGQLLAGTPPLDAVKYQIVIMFLIAAATALGTVVIVLLSYRRLFSSDHQFLHHLIQQRRVSGTQVASRGP